MSVACLLTVACIPDKLSFAEAAKLLSKTSSTEFPGDGNAFGYAARDSSGKPRTLSALLGC